MSDAFRRKLKDNFSRWRVQLSTVNPYTRLDIIEKEYALTTYQSAWQAFLCRLVLEVVGMELYRKGTVSEAHPKLNKKCTGNREELQRVSSSLL